MLRYLHVCILAWVSMQISLCYDICKSAWHSSGCASWKYHTCKYHVTITLYRFMFNMLLFILFHMGRCHFLSLWQNEIRLLVKSSKTIIRDYYNAFPAKSIGKRKYFNKLTKLEWTYVWKFSIVQRWNCKLSGEEYFQSAFTIAASSVWRRVISTPAGMGLKQKW